MYDLYHYTQIRLYDPRSEWYWDEALQDKVWKKIFFFLCTKDISMQYDWDPTVMSNQILELPPPDPKNFIPFARVDGREVLEWIDKHMKKEMLIAQAKNTMMLEIKLGGGHHDDDISAREERDYFKAKETSGISNP